MTSTTTITRPASKSILDIITTRTLGGLKNNNEEENNSYFPLHQSQQLVNANLNTKSLIMTTPKMTTTKTVNDIFILEPDSVDYSDILNQLVMSTTTNTLRNNESNDYNYNINNLFNNSDTNFLNDNKISNNNQDETSFVSNAPAIANIKSYIFIQSFLINLLFYYFMI